MGFSVLFYGLLSIPMFALSYYSLDGYNGFIANSIMVLILLFLLFLAVGSHNKMLCALMFISNIVFLNITNWVVIGQNNICMFIINICTQILFYVIAFNVNRKIANIIYLIFTIGLGVLAYYFGLLPQNFDSYLYIIYPNMFYLGLSIIITNLKAQNVNEVEYNVQN